MKRVEGRVLVDTNVLIYATLENDPRFERSREILIALNDCEIYTSVQNLAEMYPNLTGPKMELPDKPSVARAKIQSIASLPNLQVLPLTADVQSIALEICERYGITKQRYYDAQIAAIMVTHGIPTLLTENEKDFKDISEVRAINPFAS